MAKSTKNITQLRDDAIVEVISTNGKVYYKKEMKYIEALTIEKKPGWKYIIFQKGFSQFKTE